MTMAGDNGRTRFHVPSSASMSGILTIFGGVLLPGLAPDLSALRAPVLV